MESCKEGYAPFLLDSLELKLINEFGVSMGASRLSVTTLRLKNAHILNNFVMHLTIVVTVNLGAFFVTVPFQLLRAT